MTKKQQPTSARLPYREHEEQLRVLKRRVIERMLDDPEGAVDYWLQHYGENPLRGLLIALEQKTRLQNQSQ